jgi:hypothetical protein
LRGLLGSYMHSASQDGIVWGDFRFGIWTLDFYGLALAGLVLAGALSVEGGYCHESRIRTTCPPGATRCGNRDQEGRSPVRLCDYFESRLVVFSFFLAKLCLLALGS